MDTVGNQDNLTEVPSNPPEAEQVIHKTYFKHIGVVGLVVGVIVSAFLLWFVFTLETTTYSSAMSKYEVTGSQSLLTPSYNMDVPTEFVLNNEVSNQFVKRLDHFDNAGLVGTISVTTAYVGSENMRSAEKQVKEMTYLKGDGYNQLKEQIKTSLTAKNLELDDFTTYSNDRGINKGFIANFSFTRDGDVYEGRYLVGFGAQHIYDVGVYMRTDVWRANPDIVSRIFSSFAPDTK